ncbi:2-keto-4-pentenoate hydratase [Actinoplanes sichuanensis]|uniref:2-keto-4-pentenoate hydratase n=1 Tax=Actinoplanes sichuanensis TaxID=512349 RepID=A0ABW4AMR6_9ACTN|nr:2-keto-4-pentenoate hydratase [Actinoplanes sichuanensis]BEL08374.1 2-keto-4-pentenoate hydratase [Actinoplanes sichuanensis]
MIGEAEIEALADRLRDAERDRAPIPPLVTESPGLTADDAYAIQLHNIRRRSAAIVGHKVGLSSKAMQEMMGVDEPDYGHLLADMRLSEEVAVDTGRFCYPRVEIEVAFLLGADLPGKGCTEDDVLAATAAFAPSIELIDSRIVDWRISLADTIADNASSAGFVVGAQRVPPKEIDPRGIAAVLWRGDEQVAAGRSDAVLGNPVTAVAWLARKVARFGVRLKAGHLILPGACARAVDARPGDEFRAEFSGLGDVRLAFAAAKEPVGKEPVGKEPAVKEPVVKEPVGKEPAAKEPAGQAPTAKGIGAGVARAAAEERGRE